MFKSSFRLIGAALGLIAPLQAQAIINGAQESAGADGAAMVLNNRGGFCTGVFLNAQTMLTAAHCVDGAQVRVLMDGNMIVPQNIIRHPQFRAGAIASRQSSIDLAIIRLPESVASAHATLSTAPPPAPGAAVSASGFGLTREGDPKSTGQYYRVRLTVTAPYGVGKLLVWAHNNNGGGGCQGDSGGPIQDENNAVIAIISWSTGLNGKHCGHYTQGILIAPHRSWIDATLRKWSAAAQWRH